MPQRFYSADSRALAADGPRAGTQWVSGIKALAWQLRSGALKLEAGHLVLNMAMLQDDSPEKLVVIRERCSRINKIIGLAGLHPVDLEELKIYFDNLAYPPEKES
jgi:hypothetical protein